MKTRKILAGLLTAATVMTSMSMPVWADVAYTNLTAYATDYTTTFVKGSQENEFVFMVQGAAEDWSSVGGMTLSEAQSVSWRFITDGTGIEFIDIDEDGQVFDVEPMDDNTYCAMTAVRINAAVEAGLDVLEAYNTSTGYCDFSILVNNPQSVVTSVTNIQNRFYNATGENEVSLGKATCVTVASNNFLGNSNYPSVLDAPLAWLSASDTAVENYQIVDRYGTYTLKKVIFKNSPTLDTDFSDYTKPGWQYRVYDGTTGQIKELSAKVAADEYELSSNDIIVWKYGTYFGTSFANTVSLN